MWITPDDVQALLKVPITDPSDVAWLADATAAADAWAQRRRKSSGYVDSPDVVPGPDAKAGTTIFAAAVYRERGSVESFSSFEAFTASPIMTGASAQVLRLLGIPRPAVA